MAKGKDTKRKPAPKKAVKKAAPAKKKGRPKKKKAPPPSQKLIKLRKERAALYSKRYRLQGQIMGAEQEDVRGLTRQLKAAQAELNETKHSIKIINFRKTKEAKKLVSERGNLYSKKSQLLKLRAKSKTKKERATINNKILKVGLEIAAINRRLNLKGKKKKKRDKITSQPEGEWLEYTVPYWFGERELRAALRRKVFKTFIIYGKTIQKKYVSEIMYWFAKLVDKCAERASLGEYEMLIRKNYREKTIEFAIPRD